jgi:hypothetical protein
MASKHDRARQLAEEGLDKLIEGDKAGKKLIDKARKLDPSALDELAEEVEHDRALAKQHSGKP